MDIVYYVLIGSVVIGSIGLKALQIQADKADAAYAAIKAERLKLAAEALSQADQTKAAETVQSTEPSRPTPQAKPASENVGGAGVVRRGHHFVLSSHDPVDYSARTGLFGPVRIVELKLNAAGGFEERTYELDPLSDWQSHQSLNPTPGFYEREGRQGSAFFGPVAPIAPRKGPRTR